MKTLEPLQYDWLCAVARLDYPLVKQIADRLNGGGHLLKRGLYTCKPIPDYPGEAMTESIRITSAGHDAIMCFKALTGQFSLSLTS
jgi:hypothetical protein